MIFSRRAAACLTAAGFLAIVAATCSPAPEQAAESARTNLLCVFCGAFGGTDVTLNVLLFLPFAVGLRLGGLRPARIVAAAFTLSLAIESMQLFWITGRDASLGDVLANTSGGALGAWLGGVLPTIVAPASPALASRLALLGVGLWAGATTLAPVLWTPRFAGQHWWGQWAPDLEQYEQFRGTVDASTVDRIALEPGRLAPSTRRAMKERLERGEFEVTADARIAGRTERTAPIVAIFDGEGDEQIMLGQQGIDLVFAYRPASVAVELERFAVRLPRALDMPSGTPVRLRAQVRHGVVTLTRIASADTAAGRIALTPGTGWRTLLPARHSHFGPGTSWRELLFLFALLLPASYWAALSAASHRSLALLLALALVWLAAMPRLLGAAAPTASELAATSLAPLIGLALAFVRRTPRVRPPAPTN